MKEECNHYYKEKFDHGSHDQRWFQCIYCDQTPILKSHNKLVNFREAAPAKAWGVFLKELQNEAA